jgi:hypothetical protein
MGITKEDGIWERKGNVMRIKELFGLGYDRREKTYESGWGHGGGGWGHGGGHWGGWGHGASWGGWGC